MAERPAALTSTPADLSQGRRGSPRLGLLQWSARFCLLPESLPAFLAWVRSVWPECPYSDAEIADELISAHDLVGHMAEVALTLSGLGGGL